MHSAWVLLLFLTFSLSANIGGNRRLGSLEEDDKETCLERLKNTELGAHF